MAPNELEQSPDQHPPDDTADNTADSQTAAARSTSPSFYWKQSRENLFTEGGVRLFQIAYKHKDEEYESAREAIDQEYETLSPRLSIRGTVDRHGGYFTTYMTFLEEMGLMYREKVDGSTYLRATPAGDQAALLVTKLPDTLRVIPYFVIELLSRYRLNNPLATHAKNPALAAEVSESDLFPYWSLYKIMRSVGNRITKDELARFVFKMKNTSQLKAVTDSIVQYRRDGASGMADPNLDAKYGTPLTGAISQPKYIMGRAGVQTGVILQSGDNYLLNKEYLPFIDALLSKKPPFEELDEETWIRQYGAPVSATTPVYAPFADIADEEPVQIEIPDDDPVLQEVKQLLEVDRFAGVLLIGVPATGKTWYAQQVGLCLVDGDRKRLREIQFHPAYQYEDFVEGYVPDGRGGWRLAPRHLLEMCGEAIRTGQTHVLIIDELSRTDPARVMGEAMTYMESSLRGRSFRLASGTQVQIPPNLLFLATLNPEDRSVDQIDDAMDRRWGKVSLEPEPAVLQLFMDRNGVEGPVQGPVIEFFKWVQQHKKLGHAFFRTVADKGGLERLWKNQLYYVFEKAFRYDPDTFAEIEAAWQQMISRITNAQAGGGTEG